MSSFFGNLWGKIAGDGSQHTQNQYDQQVNAFTQGQYSDLWNAAKAAAAQGPGANLTSAGDFATAAQNGGLSGLAALGGDPTAVARFMNPYQQNVIDQNAQAWQKINQQTMNSVNDRATAAGAFGGSRHGVAEGVALANNNAAQAQQTAGLLQQGYQNAMQQASALAGYGQQGAGLNAQLGFGGVGNGLFGLNAMRAGYLGPSGYTGGSSTHQEDAPSLLGGLGKIGGFLAPFF